MNNNAQAHAAPLDLVALPAVLAVVAAYLLLFLSGQSLPAPFGGYNGQRWGALVLLAAVAGFGRVAPNPRSLWLPAAIVVTGLASTVLSPYPAEAAAVTTTHAGLLFLAWSCAQATQQNGAAVLRGWCCVALAAALLYSSVVVVGMVALNAIGRFDTRNLFLGFGNRRFFLQLTTMLLPCLVALSFDTALVRRFRAVGGFGALLWSMLIWLNGGSGPLYALVLGLIAAALLLGARRIAPWALAISAFMAASWLVLRIANLWLPLFDAMESVTIPDLSGRLDLWQRALTAIAERPLLGWGPGVYAYFTDVPNGHAHNMLLEWAVGYGLPGLVLAGCLFWRAFDPLRMRSRLIALPEREQLYAVAMTIGALAGLAHANVSGVTVMPMAQILLATTLGLWAGLLGHAAPAGPDNSAIRPLRLLLAAAILVTAAWSMTQNCEQQRHPQGGCTYTPAFWFAYPTSGGVEA